MFWPLGQQEWPIERDLSDFHLNKPINVGIIHFWVILNSVSIGQGVARDLERVGHGQKSRYYIILGQKNGTYGPFWQLGQDIFSTTHYARFHNLKITVMCEIWIFVLWRCGQDLAQNANFQYGQKCLHMHLGELLMAYRSLIGHMWPFNAIRHVQCRYLRKSCRFRWFWWFSSIWKIAFFGQMLAKESFSGQEMAQKHSYQHSGLCSIVFGQ